MAAYGNVFMLLKTYAQFNAVNLDRCSYEPNIIKPQLARTGTVTNYCEVDGTDYCWAAYTKQS